MFYIKSTKLSIAHCMTNFVKTLFLLFCFFDKNKACLHANNHMYMYVVLVAETPAEAARILSYFSCDVNDFLFLCMYSVKLL